MSCEECHAHARTAHTHACISRFMKAGRITRLLCSCTRMHAGAAFARGKEAISGVRVAMKLPAGPTAKLELEARELRCGRERPMPFERPCPEHPCIQSWVISLRIDREKCLPSTLLRGAANSTAANSLLSSAHDRLTPMYPQNHSQALAQCPPKGRQPVSSAAVTAYSAPLPDHLMRLLAPPLFRSRLPLPSAPPRPSSPRSPAGKHTSPPPSRPPPPSRQPHTISVSLS